MITSRPSSCPGYQAFLADRQHDADAVAARAGSDFPLEPLPAPLSEREWALECVRLGACFHADLADVRVWLARQTRDASQDADDDVAFRRLNKALARCGDHAAILEALRDDLDVLEAAQRTTRLLGVERMDIHPLGEGWRDHGSVGVIG